MDAAQVPQLGRGLYIDFEHMAAFDVFLVRGSTCCNISVQAVFGLIPTFVQCAVIAGKRKLVVDGIWVQGRQYKYVLAGCLDLFVDQENLSVWMIERAAVA